MHYFDQDSRYTSLSKYLNTNKLMFLLEYNNIFSFVTHKPCSHKKKLSANKYKILQGGKKV